MKELGITKGDIVLNASLYHATNTASWISADIGEQTVAEFKGQHYGIPHNEVPHNANLFLDAHNTAQKCGLLPSELLRQRDELREALEEQKRLYFNLFDEDVSCMYCEVKLKRGSAIILCKECAESTEV
jgi:hypothetical protein